MIIRSCYFMGKNHSRLSHHHPATFYGHRHCGSGDMFLVCHVISQKHVAIWSFDFMGKRESGQVTILTSFLVIDIVVVEM